MAIARMLPTNLFFIPEFSKLYEASKLAYIGLLLHADDEGRGRAEPHTLARAIDSYESEVQQSLEKLAASGLIITYTVDGKEYYQIKDWGNMQRGKFLRKSEYPAPPKDNHTSIVNSPADNSERPANISERPAPDIIIINGVSEKESNNNNNNSGSETEKDPTKPQTHEVEGKQYYQITDWGNMQVIRYPHPSTFPPPPGTAPETPTEHVAETSPQQAAISEPPAESPPASSSSGSSSNQENHITTTTRDEKAKNPEEGTIMKLLSCSHEAAADLIAEFPTVNLLEMEDKVPG